MTYSVGHWRSILNIKFNITIQRFLEEKKYCFEEIKYKDGTVLYSRRRKLSISDSVSMSEGGVGTV